MNPAEKALNACKEYNRLMLEIKRNTEEIGSSGCTRLVYNLYMKNGERSTHLAEVFSGYDSDGYYEPVHHHWSQAEALEIIGDCEGCRKAYQAVQERKSNKKALGAIKRTIRMIGRLA